MLMGLLVSAEFVSKDMILKIKNKFASYFSSQTLNTAKIGLLKSAKLNV